MRVAIVGGGGFIGRHVARWMAEAGAEVTTIQRREIPAAVPGVRVSSADRKSAPALRKALADAAPDVLVDMIAYTGEDMECLLAAFPSSLKRLVLISSGDVYWTYGSFLGFGPARRPSAPLDEEAGLRERLYPYRAQATDPQDLRYGYEKIVVERTAQTGAGVPVAILRLPMVYGPDDPQKRVAGCVERLRASGDTLRLNAAEAAWQCTRGYVEDVAWAIRLAALDDRAAGGVFNVGEEESLTELEWVRSIGAQAAWSGQVIADPEAPPSSPVEWGTPLVVDTRRIRDVLGYREPIGRQDGLRRTIAAAIYGAAQAGSARP